MLDGKTVWHHCMFPVNQYTQWITLYKSPTNIQSLEIKYQPIQWFYISFRYYLVICKWDNNIVFLYVLESFRCIIMDTGQHGMMCGPLMSHRITDIELPGSHRCYLVLSGYQDRCIT